MKEKNKGGRPTKYNDEMLMRTREYISSTYIPLMEELAGVLGVDSDTVTAWTKKHEEFFGLIKRLKDKQVVELVRGGLSKSLNPVMCIFLLKVKHGFVEAERQMDLAEGATVLSKIFYPTKSEGSDSNVTKGSEGSK